MRSPADAWTFPERDLYVSFSGGRDSSLILAVATQWRREHGLPDPVPITNRFTGDEASYEDDWQQLVIEHLGIREWVILQDPDVELLNDFALELLATGGPFWPPNLTTLGPAARVASGGTLLTGLDGDGLLGGWRWARHYRRLRRLARHPWEARPRDLRLGGLLLPLRWTEQDPVEGFHWLTEQGREQFRPPRHARREPRTWHKWVRWYALQVWLSEAVAGTARIGAATGSTIRHPLLEADFLQAISECSGPAQRGRTALTRILADSLPAEVHGRRSKASFNGPLWTEATRDFVFRWSGRLQGNDANLVEPRKLRSEWTSVMPNFASLRWLHSAWLADQLAAAWRPTPSNAVPTAPSVSSAREPRS